MKKKNILNNREFMSSEASSSFNKVQKCKDDSCTGGGKDRLSDLPDAVLGSILSSFPTKEAVRTSVLSMRWKYVWTFAPHIEIVDDNHYWRRSLEHRRECFRDFVDRVLRLNNVKCLPKLFLACCDDYNGRFLEWIRALTVRDIDELVLKYGGDPHVKLPHCLFMCKKLVILNLYNFVLDVHTLVCLFHLKVLRFDSVQIFDENTMKNLLAGCPVLEELDITMGFYDTTKALHIQSASLKSLRVIPAKYSYYVDDIIRIRIFIDAPNLERLNVSINNKTERFDVYSNLSSLVSVDLDLHDLSSDYYIELLNKLSTTKYLNLSASAMRSLESANLNNLPVFHYLTDLVVEIIDYSLSVLPHLLRCSPNLITFGLVMGYGYDPDQYGEFVMLNFSMLHLESVNLRGLRWSKYEMDMVKYFLKYAPVLKKMSISYSDTFEDSNLSNEEFGMPNFSMLHLESVNIHELGWSRYEMDMVKYFLKYAPVLKKMSISYSDTPEDSNLSNEEFGMPNFSMLHLESVNIGWVGWSRYDMDMVKYFLKYAPVLKKMSISYSDTPEDSNLSNEEFGMPNFSMLHLESVNIHGLGWSQYEMDMVKYFLKYAPVLKKMSISYSETPEDSNLSNEILLLPRASTECELEVFAYSFSAEKYICLSQSYQGLL